MTSVPHGFRWRNSTRRLSRSSANAGLASTRPVLSGQYIKSNRKHLALVVGNRTFTGNQSLGGSNLFYAVSNFYPQYPADAGSGHGECVEHNLAQGGPAGSGGSAGQGIGGGIYNLGTFSLDTLSVVLGKYASTSNDNKFGV